MNKVSSIDSAPLIGIERHRMGTDGVGITTLVAFYGCPLRCKYCLNPQAVDAVFKPLFMTVEELIAVISKDELYYYITKGGITFGGGEPLLYSDFIYSVITQITFKCRINLETSLNVPRENVEKLLPYIDEYIVDIKDMDNSVYKVYTGCENCMVIDNIRWLVELGLENRIICRVPIIPDYNTVNHTTNSISLLKEIGINRFDEFVYSNKLADYGWNKQM